MLIRKVKQPPFKEAGNKIQLMQSNKKETNYLIDHKNHALNRQSPWCERKYIITLSYQSSVKVRLD
mgnify:CR=1 FL=1